MVGWSKMPKGYFIYNMGFPISYDGFFSIFEKDMVRNDIQKG